MLPTTIPAPSPRTQARSTRRLRWRARIASLLVLACGAFAASTAHAQNGFIAAWQARATATLAQQPKWTTPVIAPYPQLAQVLRADFLRQNTSTGAVTWNFGNGRAANLVPFPRTEVDLLYPDYIQHSNSTVDGFGDTGVSIKYRALSANEKHGAYILSLALNSTFPSGDHKNGAVHPTLGPALSGGKGFGRFDILSTLGSSLPTAEGDRLGRTVSYNTVAQYHIGRYWWPEIEDNASWFHGGSNDGRMQNFITPGLVIGSFRFHPGEPNRRQGVAFGAAFQIATSGFHSTNHNLNITTRYYF